jgi:hypothetical protein
MKTAYDTNFKTDRTTGQGKLLIFNLSCLSSTITNYAAAHYCLIT